MGWCATHQLNPGKRGLRKHEYTKTIYRRGKVSTRWWQYRKTWNSSSPMSKLKYTHVERAITPLRHLRAVYTASEQQVRERLRREGWKLQEPSGSCENSLDLDWRSQLLLEFTPPATSIEQIKLYSSALAYPQEPPQHIPRYMAQSLLPPSKQSK